MTLTLGHGPLAATGPSTVNYRVEGPEHRLLLEPFGRRVRALAGGTVVLDSVRGSLLHESGHLPQLYVPRDDVDAAVVERTDHSTHCPFKGDASYWTLVTGERTVENALWAYEEPLDGAGWLQGLVALYWDAADAWFDEDDEVRGHLRDPYHRVDVRSSSRHVRVLADGEVVADSRRPLLVAETGLPNRWYLPETDVRPDVLLPSATHTVCAYKGEASYRSVSSAGRVLPDAAWGYPTPLDDAPRLAGHWCFDGDGVTVEVDG